MTLHCLLLHDDSPDAVPVAVGPDAVTLFDSGFESHPVTGERQIVDGLVRPRDDRGDFEGITVTVDTQLRE